MTNKNAQQQTPQQSPDSFQGMINFGMDAVHFVASIFAAPFEMALRRRIGSRYQHPVVLALAALPPVLMWAASVAAGKFVNVSNGLIGMGTLYLVFQLLYWLHVIHVVRVFANPEKEEISYEDGKPAPFWKLLLKGQSWAMVRFVYEPLTMLGLGIVLPVLGILTPAAGMYFVFGAFALFLKTLFIYYKAWEYLRDILDQFGMTRKMAGASNVSNADSVRAAVMRAASRTPVGVPMGARIAVEATAKQSLPAELQSLLSESQGVPETEGKSEEQGVLDLLTPPSPAGN
jgi:hypothetical protein